MAYNAAALEPYRELVRRGEPFRSLSCPYCNGSRSAEVKHINPARKPKSPWDFWDNIVCAPQKRHNNDNSNNGTRAEVSNGSENAHNRRPMLVVGPMVDQSELPFRLLCRRYGATLAYTPMLHARSFAESGQYRQRYFSTTPVTSSSSTHTAEDVSVDIHNGECDHPLFVQFSANDADTLLAAARHVEDYCEAVDVNFGCPQGIARRGHYGSFLMEDWECIHCMLHCLAVELRVPVTAKMRVFDDMALTLKYAEMLRDCGIAVLSVHGRTRCMKGQNTGLANMEVIRCVREHLHGSIPVIGNGNVLTSVDVWRNLLETRCEGYMCAEPLLWDPRLFAPPPPKRNDETEEEEEEEEQQQEQQTVRSGRLFAECRATRLAAIATAEEYVELVRRYPVDLGFVKAHLFKMLFHSYEMHPNLHHWLAEFNSSNYNANNNNNSSSSSGVEEVMCNAGNTECERMRSVNKMEGPFTAGLNAIAQHLRALREAELSCGVEGPQAKRQPCIQAKEESCDVFEGDDVLGIDF